MAKKSESRIIINLACSECKERTYTTTKNRKNDNQRLELMKYCPRCRTHKMHKESK
ncbi:50S ribosomal protein L33 [Chloroflexota bacterium]